MNPIKPGTRCECRVNKDHVHYNYGYYGENTIQCQSPSVRLAIANQPGPHPGYEIGTLKVKKIPMCAACADFHEKAAK